MIKLVAYAQLVRLPNVFTAMADIFLAGAATAAILDHFGSFVCILMSSSLLYMGGMVWNDWFDLNQDLRERPGRPIPSGRVSPKDAATLGVLLIAGGLLMAFGADWVDGRARLSIWIAFMLAICIFLYDGAFKSTWASPYLMGACRFFNVLLGISAAGLPMPAWGYAAAFAIGVYISGVTWFAKTEARLSKQQTLMAAAIMMAAGLLLALTVPSLALAMEESLSTSMSVAPANRLPWLFPYLLSAYGVFVGMRVVPAIRDPRPTNVQPAVRRAVLGLIAFDAIIATSLVGWPGLFILLLLVPALWLGRWLYST